jgi:hypothetical protein
MVAATSAGPQLWRGHSCVHCMIRVCQLNSIVLSIATQCCGARRDNDQLTPLSSPLVFHGREPLREATQVLFPKPVTLLSLWHILNPSCKWDQNTFPEEVTLSAAHTWKIMFSSSLQNSCLCSLKIYFNITLPPMPMSHKWYFHSYFRLCSLMVRISGPEFGSRRYQIFSEVVGFKLSSLKR